MPVVLVPNDFKFGPVQRDYTAQVSGTLRQVKLIDGSTVIEFNVMSADNSSGAHMAILRPQTEEGRFIDAQIQKTITEHSAGITTNL